MYRSERWLDKDWGQRLSEGDEDGASLPPGAELVSGRVVRVKSFAVEPMIEAATIEQMELLSHKFFLSRDVDNDGLALLYCRQDGDYGMISVESE